MDIKNFLSAISQIAEEKGIPYERVIESIESAIAAAYKKEYGKKGQIVKSKLNPETGEAKFWQVKLVVDENMIYTEEELEALKEQGIEKRFDDESFVKPAEGEIVKVRFNPEKHLLLEEAKKIDKKLKPGDELEIPLEVKQEYGRIAAQTAKQVILQKIREAERETILSEFKKKEGEVVSGMVQRIEGGNVFMDIDKTIGILPREEQIPGEFYRPNQRLKVYVLKVEDAPRGPMILLSRAYPKFISKLFEIEVPEIAQDNVQIKALAREPGSRSKVAVTSTVEGIDPIGSMVGQRGTRVLAVINELAGEKIDIIEYADDPEKFIANAMSPAKVVEVKKQEKNTAVVIVPEDQLSLAIGRDGQNVRLAAKLTGWKIDVRSAVQESVEENEKALAEEVDEKKSTDGKEEIKEKKKEKKVKKPAKKKKDLSSDSASVAISAKEASLEKKEEAGADNKEEAKEEK